MADFSWAEDLAQTLIGQNGSDATLVQQVVGAFDPITGVETGATTATTSLLAVELPMGAQDEAFLPDTLTLSQTAKVLVAAKDAARTPAPGDRLTLHGRTLTVEAVQHLQPAGGAIMWTLFCRQG